MDSPREDLMAAAELSSAPWQVLELHSISPTGGVAMTSKAKHADAFRRGLVRTQVPSWPGVFDPVIELTKV